MSGSSLYTEYSKPPTIMLKLSKVLEGEGHTCVSIIGSQHHKFYWCERDLCVANPSTESTEYSTESSDEVAYV
jgi:hypothetical protein